MANWFVDSGLSNRSFAYNYESHPLYQDEPIMEFLTSQAQPYMSHSSPAVMSHSDGKDAESAQPPPPPEPPKAMPRETPREIRNRAEKQRRDKLNNSISELAKIVPPVVSNTRKLDKTGVLRLTAHFLRSHQYVFGKSIGHMNGEFNARTARFLLQLVKGFVVTTTHRGIIVVVSHNITEYLGYSEVDLLGQNILNLIHADDHELLRQQFSLQSHLVGPNGELLIPNEPDGENIVAEALSKEKRIFAIRFKKLTQRSEPPEYVMCVFEGSFRKSDNATRNNRCGQMVRRARARGYNPFASGNDIVFVGVVRPTTETFLKESQMESYRMEYRTRHTIDGEIIQCEQRISLATGYMTHEVSGLNALNFMHRDDVHWVVFALREMYDNQQLFGESCYRLMAKNGQFIYMHTRGRLDVNPNSTVVTSFVCTNTVVSEEEGKQLIKKMKEKIAYKLNNIQGTRQNVPAETDDQNVSVEDPRQLEKIILHLLTNLPSSGQEHFAYTLLPNRGEISPLKLEIIPPQMERMERIHEVLNVSRKDQTTSDSNNALTEEEIPAANHANISSQDFYNYCEESELDREIEEINSSSFAQQPSVLPNYVNVPSSTTYYPYWTLPGQCSVGADYAEPGPSSGSQARKRPKYEENNTTNKRKFETQEHVTPKWEMENFLDNQQERTGLSDLEGAVTNINAINTSFPNLDITTDDFENFDCENKEQESKM